MRDVAFALRDGNGGLKCGDMGIGGEMRQSHHLVAMMVAPHHAENGIFTPTDETNDFHFLFFTIKKKLENENICVYGESFRETKKK